MKTLSFLKLITAHLAALLFVFALHAEEEIVPPFPLAPPDTSSPAATLQSFLENTELAYKSVEKRELSTAHEFLERARQCLDLTNVPPNLRNDKGTELSLLLIEILSRLDAESLKGAPEDNETDDWRIPQTLLKIQKRDDDPRKGEYLFNEASITRIPRDYQDIKDLPYVRKSSPHFYKWFLSSPGNFSKGWFDWTHSLPSWAHTLYFGQTIWQWIIFILVTLLSIFLVIVILKNRNRIRSPLLRHTLPWILLAAIALFTEWLVHHEINITGIPLVCIQAARQILYYTSLALLLWGVVSYILSRITLQQEEEETQSSHWALICLVAKLLTVIACVIIIGYGVNQVGIPLAGVIAGFGVGGLAFGLAAQPTLQNLFGCISLLTDKPVEVGDYCKFGDSEGTIEGIGFRSTRIRRKDRTITTIPNDEFCKMRITNLGRRDKWLFEAKVKLPGEATSEQVDQVREEIIAGLTKHSKVDGEADAHLTEFKNDSLTMDIDAYVNVSDYDDFLTVREDLFLTLVSYARSSELSIELD